MYLSPALFPDGSSVDLSNGIEIGFFFSQASGVLFALVVVGISRTKLLQLPPQIFFCAALAATASTVLITEALLEGNIALVVAGGLIDGVCMPLLIVSWGTRYILGSKNTNKLVVLSFLLAYLVYMLVAYLPAPVSLISVAALPLVSWLLWKIDTRMRYRLSLEASALLTHDEAVDVPGELSAGSWEARVLPWRSIGTLLVAAFIGNLMTSIMLGFDYRAAEQLIIGGIVTCAAIATLNLILLIAFKDSFSIKRIYQVTIIITATGLIIAMVFPGSFLTAGGSLVLGSAFFLQVIIYLTITQSTRQIGISPLLSFSLGQGLIAGIVLLGNVVGKQLFMLIGSVESALPISCGIGLLGLFIMLVLREKPQDETTSRSYPWDQDNPNPDIGEEPRSLNARKSSASSLESDDPKDSREAFGAEVEVAARRFNLTPREKEVFSLLVKGRSLPYIADVLFVTTGTIKTHTTHIYRKLSISSRQELLDLFEQIVLEESPASLRDEKPVDEGRIPR